MDEDITKLKLVRLARYALNQIPDFGMGGGSSIWRQVFHTSVQVLHKVMENEIPPERLTKFREVLDKFVQDGRMDAGGSAAKGDWVTIGGTHVLLGEGGVALSGGKLKGMTFANAKSQKSSGKGSSAQSAVEKLANTPHENYKAATPALESLKSGDRISFSTSWGDPTYEKQETGEWVQIGKSGKINPYVTFSDEQIAYAATGTDVKEGSIKVMSGESEVTAKVSAKPNASPTQKPSEPGNFVNPVTIGTPVTTAATPQSKPAEKSAENAQKQTASPKAQTSSQTSTAQQSYGNSKLTMEQRRWLDSEKARLSSQPLEQTLAMFESYGGQWTSEAKKARDAGNADKLIDDYISSWSSGFDSKQYDIPDKSVKEKGHKSNWSNLGGDYQAQIAEVAKDCKVSRNEAKTIAESIGLYAGGSGGGTYRDIKAAVNSASSTGWTVESFSG